MSIIKQITLQKIVAHDFRYDPRNKILTAPEISNLLHFVEFGSTEFEIFSLLG